MVISSSPSRKAIPPERHGSARARWRLCFTTPQAVAGTKGQGPFDGKSAPQFDEIALFPIPSLTMHFVMAGEGGAAALDDLEGQTPCWAKALATEGEKYLTLFGLADKVEIGAELSNAVAALKGPDRGVCDRRVLPAPNVVEAAASTPCGWCR